MKSLSLSLLFICLNAISASQISMDGIWSKLDSIPGDSAKIDYLLNTSRKTRVHDPAEATIYADSALKIAQKSGNQLGTARALNNIGIAYTNRGSYDIAFEYLVRSMDIYRMLEYNAGIGSITNSIGRLYYELEDYSKALSYFREGLKIYKQLGGTSHGVANFYINIGGMLDHLGKPDSGYYYIKNAIDTLSGLGDSTYLPSAYLNLGEHYELLGDDSLARMYYYKAYTICKIRNLYPRLSDSYEHLGRSFMITGNYNQAILYLDSAYLMAQQIASITNIKSISKNLYESYSALGDFQNALYYQDVFSRFNDSIRNMAIGIQLAQLEWDRQREMEVLVQAREVQKQKLLRNFALIAFLLVIITLAVLYRNYRMKQKSNQLLEEIDRMKSQMFSNISHEFRTPLTLILGPLEEMLQEESAKKPPAKTLQLMRRNADRLLNLVNQMMDLSKMDAGQLKLELIQGDVIQAVKLMILAFSSLAEKKKINYEYQLPETGLSTYYDPDKIEKIINNLLSNAFKFTPEDGKVLVSVTTATGKKTRAIPPFSVQTPTIEIAVTDTGKGIPKDQLDKVFDRFHQVEGSFELGSAGTGIGLALTRELVDLMHGKVTVESILGAGSRFTVLIPLGIDHLSEDEYSFTDDTKKPARTDAEHIKEPEKAPLAAKRDIDALPDDKPALLIVEDHEDIRQHIKESMTDYHIIEGENGREGLSQATEHIPDLIITDLMMPLMDGVELCKNLKTDERTSHIPVIMLTAKASVNDRIEGLETGADAYITKPFNMKEMKVQVSNLIEQRRKLRERFSKDVSLGPKDIAVTSADEKFLNAIIEAIEENMQDAELDVAGLSKHVAMSRMQLYRKIKALTDQTPTEFIRTMRLKRAAQLMRDKFGNIAEITYEVGFNHPSYFAKSFKELFGESPSDYMKKQ